MTQFSQDDRLVKFLRQHTSNAPPAAPDLEQQIMKAVAASPQQSALVRRQWIVPSAIAAGVLISWTCYRALTPAKPTAAEVAGLETFMESNWDGALGGSAEAESFPLTSPTPTPKLAQPITRTK